MMNLHGLSAYEAEKGELECESDVPDAAASDGGNGERPEKCVDDGYFEGNQLVFALSYYITIGCFILAVWKTAFEGYH
uniref:Proton-dependent oligopeptide or low-affinity nitrate transporter n=1 Tax=Angiostrongylus cantonensis TaxID=6313 RepID=A0A0K0D790_ANGCA